MITLSSRPFFLVVALSLLLAAQSVSSFVLPEQPPVVACPSCRVKPTSLRRQRRIWKTEILRLSSNQQSEEEEAENEEAEVERRQAELEEMLRQQGSAGTGSSTSLFTLGSASDDDDNKAAEYNAIPLFTGVVVLLASIFFTGYGFYVFVTDNDPIFLNVRPTEPPPASW